MTLSGKKVVVVGGSSGIGLASARLLAAEGAEVIIASRSREKLDAARESIEGRVGAFAFDMVAESETAALFQAAGRFDHLVIAASEAVMGGFLELDIASAMRFFQSKFWGPYLVAKHGAPHINEGGSITFFSGAAGRRASPGFSCGSAINAAVEALARTLALELAPVRVNTISPGIVETPVWGDLIKDAAEREALLKREADKLPLKRVGRPEEIAHAVLFLIGNQFMTGSTLIVDGGYLLT